MARQVVLVSGAGGFIGRWSVPPLVAQGDEVHAIVGRAGRARRTPPPQLRGATLHELDLFDTAAVAALLQRVGATHLLHFAWIAVPGEYATSADNPRWLAASRTLLQAFHAAGGVRAVMAGTCAEYDASQVGVCHEFSSPLADAAAAATPYALCKIAMQRALADFGRTQPLSTAWGRIFFQFGPDEHPARLVASVITNLLAGRPARCSHGTQIRSFLHVADVGAAFAALLGSALEGPVNIGSAQRISVAHLLEQVVAQVGRPELLRLGARPAAADEPAVLVPDMGRLSGELGFQPRFGLTDAIADTVAWWRHQSTGAAPGAAELGAAELGAAEQGAAEQGAAAWPGAPCP